MEEEKSRPREQYCNRDREGGEDIFLVCGKAHVCPYEDQGEGEHCEGYVLYGNMHIFMQLIWKKSHEARGGENDSCFQASDRVHGGRLRLL